MTRPAELSAVVALGWSLVVTCALLAIALVIGGLFGSSNLSIVVAGPAELLLMLPAARLIARFYVAADVRNALALRSASPLELVIGASLGVILHLPAGYLSELVERRFPTPPESLHAQLVALTPSSNLLGLLMLLSVAAIVPFTEELFYRGALFSALVRRNSGALATWTTSIGFVLAHQEARNWAPLLLVALVLGELRRHSGSIWPGVALHAAFNAATLLVVFVTRPSEIKPETSSWQLALGGAILSAVGIWLFGRVSERRLLEAS